MVLTGSMRLRVLYEKKPIEYEMDMMVDYDEELGFFFEDFCNEVGWPVHRCRFSWFREDGVSIPLESDWIPSEMPEMGMAPDMIHTVWACHMDLHALNPVLEEIGVASMWRV